MNIQTREQIEEVRKGYPMYQRYLCCSCTIGYRHAQRCPSSPDPLGPADGQREVEI